MKKPVNDALVAEYAKRLRAGGPLGQVFPFPLSECDFTEQQKLIIKQARAARKQRHKARKRAATAPAPPAKPVVASKPAQPIQQNGKSFSKLEKMLYLQQANAFSAVKHWRWPRPASNICIPCPKAVSVLTTMKWSATNP